MASPYEQAHTIRQIALNSATWTDVVGVAYIPLSCNVVIITNLNSVAIALRSDPNNANSQITLQPGQSFQIGVASPSLNNAGGNRFPVGSGFPVCSLLSTAGNVNAVVECIQ